MKDFIIIFLPTTIGVVLFNFFIENPNLLLIFLSLTMFFSFGSMVIQKFDDNFSKKIDEEWDGVDPIMNPILNHTNLIVRKHKRDYYYYKEIEHATYCYFGWCVFLLLVAISPKSKILNLFNSTIITDIIFRFKKNIVKEETIIQNSKELNVTYFNTGIIEYRYKGKLHRENNLPAIEVGEEYYLQQVKVEEYYIYGNKYTKENVKNASYKIAVGNF
jgi:hypothetical protein